MSSGDTHPTCRTKSRERPGRTNACVTSRASPFSTTLLQPLHLALPVGASPMEKVGGRVLKLLDFMLARDLRYDEGVEGVGGSWNSQPGWGESWNSTLSEAHSPSPRSHAAANAPDAMA